MEAIEKNYKIIERLIVFSTPTPHHTQPPSILGYDRIALRRSRNRNRIFYYLIPVVLTGTGICHGKSGSGRTGTGFFRIESGSGKNRISRSDRNSGRNRNIMNANPARTEIAENDKNPIYWLI